MKHFATGGRREWKPSGSQGRERRAAQVFIMRYSNLKASHGPSISAAAVPEASLFDGLEHSLSGQPTGKEVSGGRSGGLEESR
jgi:hypothetical protein